MIFPKVLLPSLCLFSFASAFADGLALRISSLAYFETADFVRISEYFTGKENTSGRVILRTEEGDRAGLYFRLKISGSQSPITQSPVCLLLHVLDSNSLDFKTHRFDLSPEALKKKEVLIGLTGEDWSSKETFPIAWQFQMQDLNGTISASAQSRLWSHEK